MEAVILNGSPAGKRGDACRRLADLVVRELHAAGIADTTFPLAEMDIAPCRGCFRCWTRTPGRCVIRDDQENLMPALARCGLRVLVTPVVFGGYGALLKRSLDRGIPILLPFMVPVHGEIHHPQRYPLPHRDLLVLGCLDHPRPDWEETFTRLAARNALNMAARPVTAVFTADTPDGEISRRIRALLDGMEVTP